MRRFFFLGYTKENNGPENVNKGIVENLSDKFCYIHSENKVKIYMEALINTLSCKVLVVSGISKCGYYMMNVARIFNKKSIYIMHGCNEIEMHLNELDSDKKCLKWESEFLKNATLILPVSERYSSLIRKRYPMYDDKIKYLYNGVYKPQISQMDFKTRANNIVAIGGNKRLKNNYSLARAIDKVQGDVTLTIFGNVIDSKELLKSNKVQFVGKKPQNELFETMLSSKLFVLNSICESFSLTVLEALFCGCSILVSNCAGVLDILKVTNRDIIYDPFDEDEIAEKISYLLEYPNNERIMNSIDLESLSYAKQVERLEAFCIELLCKDNQTEGYR